MNKLIGGWGKGEGEDENSSVRMVVVVTSSVYIAVGWPRTTHCVIANTM